jgi:hypothetical protein
MEGSRAATVARTQPVRRGLATVATIRTWHSGIRGDPFPRRAYSGVANRSPADGFWAISDGRAIENEVCNNGHSAVAFDFGYSTLIPSAPKPAIILDNQHPDRPVETRIGIRLKKRDAERRIAEQHESRGSDGQSGALARSDFRKSHESSKRISASMNPIPVGAIMRQVEPAESLFSLLY